jgi:hypothetical protein
MTSDARHPFRRESRRGPDPTGPDTWWQMFCARWGIGWYERMVAVMLAATLVHMALTLAYGPGTSPALVGFSLQMFVVAACFGYKMARDG